MKEDEGGNHFNFALAKSQELGNKERERKKLKRRWERKE